MTRRRPPAALTPGELVLALQAITVDLQRLARDYQGTYLVAWGPAVLGDGGRAGGSSDPTGATAIALGRKRLRDGLAHVSEDTRDMQATVRSMLYTLDRVMSAADPPPSANLRLEDQMRASRAEVAASVEAQHRRQARGEGWGG